MALRFFEIRAMRSLRVISVFRREEREGAQVADTKKKKSAHAYCTAGAIAGAGRAYARSA